MVAKTCVLMGDEDLIAENRQLRGRVERLTRQLGMKDEYIGRLRDRVSSLEALRDKIAGRLHAHLDEIQAWPSVPLDEPGGDG